MLSGMQNAIVQSSLESRVGTGRTLIVRAGPGSGKTHTVVELVKAHVAKGISPSRICAISFTRRASEELKIRLGANLQEVFTGTIDSLALELVRMVEPNAQILSPANAQVVFSHVCTMIGMKPTQKLFAEFQQWREKCEEGNNDLAVLNDNYWSFLKMGQVYDYQSVMLRAMELRDIRTSVGFKIIILDEAQDTSRLQWDLIEMLVHDERAALVAVGDVNQTIYSWRNARPQIFESYRRQCLSLPLVECYRCSPPIVDYGNRIIELNPDAIADVRSVRTGVFEPVQVMVGDVARAVSTILNMAYAYDDVAILCRTNRTVSVVENTLTALGYPVNAVRPMEAKESFLAMAAQFAINKDNPVIALLFAHYATKGELIESLGLRNLTSISWESLVLELSQTKDGRALIEYMAQCQDEYCVFAEALIHLQEVDLFYQESKKLKRRYGAYVIRQAISALNSPEDLPRPQNEITVCTVHQAKGLEWNSVVVADLAEGKFPSAMALRDEDGIEEERRVMYVAVTRAKDVLILLADEKRPSQFILSGEVIDAGKTLGEAEKAIRSAGF